MILSTPWWRIGWLFLAGLCVATSLPAAGPVRPAPLTDTAGQLSASDLARARDALTTIGRHLNLELAAVVEERLPPGVDLKPYTTALATQWSIGAGHRGGAVLFLYVADRKIAIRTDSALRPRLSDATCARIIAELGPDARARNWGAVVEGFAQKIENQLATPRPVASPQTTNAHATSTTRRASARPFVPAPRPQPSLLAGPVFLIIAGVFLVVLVRVMIGISRSVSYGRRGYASIYKHRGWTDGAGVPPTNDSAFNTGFIAGSWWSSHHDSSSSSGTGSSGFSFGDSGGGGGGGDCSGGGGADGSF